FDEKMTKPLLLKLLDRYIDQDYGAGLTIRCQPDVLYTIDTLLFELMIDLAGETHPLIFRGKPNRKAIVSVSVMFTATFFT
ncbi:MAG: hypothetical protein CUN57_03325, partial [Phototrophicales bacterium]